MQLSCRVVEACASRPLASVRQHFLKRTLFFLVCWCIRDAVHFDSRVHAAIKPSHNGGQHGQESEEGEEGEERSEEDCEEDPQGREEEEVTSRLEEMPAV